MLETILLIAIAVALLWLALRHGSERKESARFKPPVLPRPEATGPPPDDALGRERMFAEISAKARYQRKRLLHDKEFELLTKLEQRVGPGGTWKLARPVRVLPQVSLGEALGARPAAGASRKFEDLAQGAVNSKRVDLLLTCHYCHPRVAIELQGWRHTSDPRTMLRDTAKRNALVSAGIALVEIGADETEDDYMPRIHKALAEKYPEAFQGKRHVPLKGVQGAGAHRPEAGT